MKFLLASILLLSLTNVAFASRGYLYEDSRRDVFFQGVASHMVIGDLINISWAYENGEVSRYQVQNMVECMKYKNTHAIEIKQAFKPARPGSMFPVGDAYVASVECVRAPGLYSVWLKQMSKYGLR